MKIVFLVFSLLFVSAAVNAAEVGEHGYAKLVCLTQDAAKEIIKAENHVEKMNEMLARQLCASGPPVPVTLKTEHRVGQDGHSVWEIEEQAGVYIIAPRSEGEDS